MRKLLPVIFMSMQFEMYDSFNEYLSTYLNYGNQQEMSSKIIFHEKAVVDSLLMLERAHFSSNSSFIELQNFEFEHIASSCFFNFSSLSSSLVTSFPSFGPNISSISSFIEFEFALNTNHRVRV